MSGVEQIIYGKRDEECIVNISIKDDTAYLFQEIDGIVSHVELPFKQWVLSPFPGPGFDQLEGRQHYKYIKSFSESEFDAFKKQIYQRKLYTAYHKAENFMIKEGFTYFKNMKPTEPSVLSFDIEATGLDPQRPDATVLLITNTLRKAGKITRKAFVVEDYPSQIEMMEAWCDWVRENDPSILCGHNAMSYDIFYMKTIMNRADKELLLGRDGSPLFTEKNSRELRKDGSQSYAFYRSIIFGREIVDTFFLAIKFDIARKYSSYGLKSIIREEGLEKEGRTFIDASKIAKEWKDPEKRKLIIQYGIEDSDDALKLFDLMIPAMFYLTTYVPKPLQIMVESATGSQINAIMVRSYLQDGFSVAKATDGEKFEGAISFGKPGIYRNVLKVDVASLYPSIMLQYKIEDKYKDYNGNFQKMLQYMTKERLKNKKLAKETGDRYYDDLQNSQKTMINSCYGFMGAVGLNYNYPNGAAETTRKGREILDRSIIWATGKTYREINPVEIDE